MTLYQSIQQHIADVVASVVENADAALKNIALEQPKDLAHGDLATNAAMVMAKSAGQHPRALAEQFLPKILEHEALDSGDIAGPGFINLRLKQAAWMSEMAEISQNNASFDLEIGHQEKVMVEFVSINPTGPIHVGHGRNAVLGDTLCRVLEKTNYNVYREYLVNDAGNQIRTLVLSVHARYLELFGQELALPEDGYVGEYIIDIAQALKDKDGDKWLQETDEDTLLAELRAFCVDACMSMIRADLDVMGITFDRFHSEYEMHQEGDPLAAAVQTLRDKGYVYEGKLEAPKGKDIQDYVPVELTLFKSTEFGAEQDKPIYNRRGLPTYFGQDIAYAQHKLQRGYTKQVVVIDARQEGNFTPLKWALEALTGHKDALHPFYYGLVNAERDGKPVKLSKRAGNIISLSGVLDEVGSDAYRFHMLTRKGDTPLVFDLAKAVEKSMDNPVFYVQYAHARMCAVFRQAAELGIDAQNLEKEGQNAETIVTNDGIRGMLQQIVLYPQILERAAVSMEPHRLAFYAQDFAAAFHSWYNDEKFLDADNVSATRARLLVVKAAQLVLADLLDVMGISAPEQM